MAVRKIRIWPDPALKEVAKPVMQVTDEIRMLVTDLFETMYAANGVGLASTQIAVPLRVLVIDLDPSKHHAEDPEVAAELKSWGYKEPTAFINPEILSSHGRITWDEGCLSVPGYTDSVERFEQIRVRALNTYGEFFEVEASGLFSVALQHEMDHLDGKVFVEYLSKIKRDTVKRKMLKIKESHDDGIEAAASIL